MNYLVPILLMITSALALRKKENAYDILLRAAMASESVEARDAYLADAERLLLESGYVIPLCGTTYRYLLREGLTGLICNDMGVYNFSAMTQMVA